MPDQPEPTAPDSSNATDRDVSERRMLAAWLDSWSSAREVIDAMTDHGYNVRLSQSPFGWWAEFCWSQVSTLPKCTYGEPQTDAEARRATADLLHRETAAMNLDNFVVRPRHRVVEKDARPEAWVVLPPEALSELSHEVAGLPSEVDPEGEEAKRFDLLVLNLQLAMLRSEPGFVRLREQVKEIAGLLEEKAAIPMVRDQMELILDAQTDEWWQDVTLPMLEVLRRRLRDLVKFIEKQKRKLIYTDFEDQLGGETPVDLRGFAGGTDYAKFRAKAQAFLRAHQDHIAIHKLRMNKPLTATDLADLERILVESGIGGPDDIRRAADESQGLGLFVRSLIGMDPSCTSSGCPSGRSGHLPAGVAEQDVASIESLAVSSSPQHSSLPARPTTSARDRRMDVRRCSVAESCGS
jgi:EcoEI R protein C-terminal